MQSVNLGHAREHEKRSSLFIINVFQTQCGCMIDEAREYAYRYNLAKFNKVKDGHFDSVRFSLLRDKFLSSVMFLYQDSH